MAGPGQDAGPRHSTDPNGVSIDYYRVAGCGWTGSKAAHDPKCTVVEVGHA
jgi:hypothetical protein